MDATANDDFLVIVEWIAVNNPDARELVIPGLPYVAVYCIESAPARSVVILRVLHGAMLWPPDAGKQG